ncbi:MAG: type II toxin-antitoxin system RelE/ParE family toxin [Desulfobacterales bacterium]|nr:type II toxin-antitoxin system RelE/ParE family toxin [Desulfobacterales bacterium]
MMLSYVIMNAKKIIVFKTENNKEPYTEWIKGFKDIKTKLRILDRINRLEVFGHYGDYRTLGDISELKLHFGAGYRVYFGEIENTIILLCGGDKSKQQKDIEKVKEYWRLYNENL